jgi:hypothetical protein
LIIDLSPAKPYLNAIRTAESFPAFFFYCEDREGWELDYEMEQAMEEIDREVPWLWPAIDRAILSQLMFDVSDVPYDRCR